MAIVFGSSTIYNDCNYMNAQVLQGKTAMEILEWSYNSYGKDLVYACSLGAEGMVLLDLISKVQPGAKVIFLDTDFHFKETYTLLEEVKKRYSELEIKVLKPDLNPEEQAKEYGRELWKKDPDRCCLIRKINPLEKELVAHSAWISGLRREQSLSRKNVQFINVDERFRSVKICPLIHWSWNDVWFYINENKLPYNSLHDKNYPSIGCFHCTKTVADGEDSRSGRWQGIGKTECGLHR